MRRTSPHTVLAALALAGTLVLSACAGGSADGAGSDAPAATTAPDAAGGTAAPDAAGETAAVGQEVDLEALPDPVAEVNGEPISRQDLVQALEPELARTQAQGGMPVDEVALRDAVLDNLVSLELVRQEAQRLDLEATEQDVDAELDALAAQNGMGSGEEFLTALEAQGVSEEQAREEVAALVLFDGILADRGGVPEPTEQELRDYYEQVTGQPADEEPGEDGAAATDDPAQLPGFEQIRDQLEEQLTQQQEQERLTAILEELRQEAEVELRV
jgi:peptidyl-prolyl cis-trans isomerase SurA